MHMGAMNMYIDFVYGCYIHVYLWCILVVYTCMFMLYMHASCMHIDGVYGCYVHVC